MNLKKVMYERIKKNSIEINVGTEENPRFIYLKNDKFGWHVIHPPINIKSLEDATDRDGNINWKKVKWDKIALIFGSKSNAISTTIVGVVVLLLAFGVWQLIASYQAIVTNPIVRSCIKNAGLSVIGG